jgi:branched-chain amino acid transport system ATP-binding protein
VTAGSATPAALRQSTMLDVCGLDAGYGAIQVLWDVSLRVDEGEIVTVLGSNGAGKSTAIKAVCGLVRPWRGAIELADPTADGGRGGVRIDAWPAHRIVDAGLVLIPEGRQIWGELSVRDNLELGAFSRRARAERDATLAWVHALFPVLEERARLPARALSGGQQQMLAIARGLMSRPRLLVLDEPSLGLAPQVVEQVFATLVRINEEGITLMLVEQNVDIALQIADRGYLIENGRIVLEGPSDAFRASDRIRASYLGL